MDAVFEVLILAMITLFIVAPRRFIRAWKELMKGVKQGMDDMGGPFGGGPRLRF